MFNVFEMSGFDREITVAEKAYDIAMSELAYLEAMVDAKLKINLARSEYKVLTESTADSATGDLVYLYNEAAKEAEGQSEGFFAKAKEAVLAFFTTVWNSIQKIFTKEDTEAYKNLQASKKKVKLPLNVKFITDKGSEVATAVEGNDTAVNKGIKVAKVLGITAAAGAGIAGLVKFVSSFKEKAEEETEMTEGEAVSCMEKLKNIFPKLMGSVKNSNEDSTDKEGIGKKILDVLKNIGGFVSKAINAIRNALHMDVKDSDESKTPENTPNNEPAKGNGGPSIAMQKSQGRVNQAQELRDRKIASGVGESADDDLGEDFDPVME